ncbi:hypothetical protein RFI_06248, partial [Reticulomyxa filosa]
KKHSEKESSNANDNAMDWTMSDDQMIVKDESDKQLWPNLDFQGVLGTWVKVFPTVKAAVDDNGSDWTKVNPFGKLHEYQLQVNVLWKRKKKKKKKKGVDKCREGIMVVNLNEKFGVSSECLDKGFEMCAQNYVSDHGYCGYVLRHHMVLHQPSRYWRLIDDDKKQGRTQFLISDLFRAQLMQQNHHLQK